MTSSKLNGKLEVTRAKTKIDFISYFATLFFLLLSALFSFPFIWMMFATSKANPEIFNTFPLLPEEFHLRNFKALLTGEWIPYPRQLFNALLIATVQTFLALTFSASAGFVFAQYQFRGKKILFALAVLVVLVPRQVLVLPLFMWMNQLGQLDGPWSVILPGVVSGIGILYFTQVFKHIPKELLDLARSEGASEYGVYVITLPLVKPALIAFGLIHFIMAWHEHLIPLVMLTSKTQMTAGVALSSLYGSSRDIPMGLLMAGSALTVVPTAILYLMVQKHFKSSLAKLTLQ